MDRARHASMMLRDIFVLFLSFLFCFLHLNAIYCGELSESLRDAAEKYRSGRYSEARVIAESHYKAFPKDIEGLLILARIEFALKNLKTSRMLIRQASAVNPKHPLVIDFRKIFDEYEHRHGILESDPQPIPVPDKTVTYDRYKRAWFGPAFPSLSARIEPASASSEIIQTPSEASRKYSSSSPGTDPTDSVERLAEKAMNDKLYFKAYLYYSQLAREAASQERIANLTLEKAQAAFHMGRYKEVVSLLENIRNFFAQNSTLQSQSSRAGELLEKSMEMLNSQSLHP